MASVTQNVVRWSALATGVLYGAVHLRSVKNIQAKEEEHHVEKHHQELVEKARKAWDEKTASQSKSSNGLITDPENPSFDLEKFLEAKSKEN